VATLEEIAWAAGFFEGEGSITHTDRDLQLLLKNTDRDMVARFAQIVYRGVVYGPYTSADRDGYRRKPYWMWVALGDAGHDVVDLLAPWLSRRRLEQALAHGVVTPYTGERKT
jgi:hypothetical protein